MGAGASARLQERISSASGDDIQQALANLSPDVTAKLAAGLAAARENARRQELRDMLGGLESNVLPVSGPNSVARSLLHSELEFGSVEFFCGSGVGYALCGVDWVGLVNLGAKNLLQGAGEAWPPEKNEDFELVTSCYSAFGDDGTPEARTALLKTFGESFLKLVKAYAQAVDSCMFACSTAGMPCSQTYNMCIAEYMSECHATERCPTSLGRAIAKGILKQLKLRPDRVYSMYTTNYSRSVNMALLELGVTVEEIYPVRYNFTAYNRRDAMYDEDVRVVRSVLTPMEESATAATVQVFHMHGIAKGRAEFLEPGSPGPNRPKPFWKLQEHFDLGAAKDFFDDTGKAVSFVEAWASSSGKIKCQPLPVGKAMEAEKATELYEAAAEGILITDAQYGCKAHAKVLKSSFRLALDDTERTVVIQGSSLTDAFFKKDLNANLDENGEVKDNADEALDDSDDEEENGCKPCEGITLNVGVKPNPKFMDGPDVMPKLKPYLYFAVSRHADGTPDFTGIGTFTEACL